VDSSLTLRKVTLEDLDNQDCLLQSGFWGFYKQKSGQTAHPFLIDSDQTGKPRPLLVLERPLPGGGSLGYVPHGPSLPSFYQADPAAYLSHLGEILRSHLSPKCVFLRFDLPWYGNAGKSMTAGAAGRLVKAPVDVQPPATVIIDLEAGEDEILKRMKSKTRYNIRLAGKRGVEVVAGNREDLSQWYAMYRETSVRDKIAIHSYEYYHQLFISRDEYEGNSPELLILLARVDKATVAGNIVALHGKQAVYLYGASLSKKRNLMPTYALQWKGIQKAREQGCTSYDLFGIPPTDRPDHPMHGLYRFKTGFGGAVIHRAGCWDYLFKPGKYRLLHIGERARDYYFKKFRKR